MTIKLGVLFIVALIKLYLANCVLCLVWMLLYIYIILVWAISFTVNIADYVYVLTLSDIMVFYCGFRWLMIYVLLIHIRCLKIISGPTCLLNAKIVFMWTIFIIMHTSLVSLNFSSNCLCIREFSCINLGFWGFPVVLILSILSIWLWYNWCIVSWPINASLLKKTVIPLIRSHLSHSEKNLEPKTLLHSFLLLDHWPSFRKSSSFVLLLVIHPYIFTGGSKSLMRGAIMTSAEHDPVIGL